MKLAAIAVLLPSLALAQMTAAQQPPAQQPPAQQPPSQQPPSQQPLSGPAFDTYTRGKTMTYAEGAQVWGREQYLPGGQVIWAFEGQGCKHGSWQETAPGLICFTYEDNPADLECWQFFLGQDGLTARSMKPAAFGVLAAIDQTADPLLCPGPDVGV